MTQKQQSFALRGGLDQQTPNLFLPPGYAVACLNHEAVQAGYQRTEGYERYDGRTAPSSATFSILTFNTGVSAFVAGETITGFSSGATARVLAVADVQGGSFGGGNASGRLAVVPLAGNFTIGELLKVGGTTRATLLTAPVLGDQHAGTLEMSWLVASQTYYRGLIQPLDTIGGIRGVLIYGNRVYAFSDSAGQGQIYSATTGGWSLINKQFQMKFGAGAFQTGIGLTLTGVTSGATCKLRYIAIDSGDFGTSNAAGIYVVDTVVGTFQVGETIRHNVGEVAGTVVTVPTAVALPAGGRYSFRIFNFYATDATGYGIAYGINRVGQAFEFNGSYIAPISTGMATDTPVKIAEHKNQLFLGFAGGSLQNSGVGTPRNFSGVAGAAEIGVGSDITNLIGNTSDVLVITTTKRIYALTGNDSSDFQLSPQGAEDSDTGAKEFTAQNVGQLVYMDDAGVRSITSGQYYGNMRLGTFTAQIVQELVRKKAAGVTVVGSCVVKSKSQYLLFFSDGSGISLFFAPSTIPSPLSNGKPPEAMLFTYPFVVESGPAVGMINGIERVFVGATNGYVYELNKGTSFDGAAIPASFQLPFTAYGDPLLDKRFMSLKALVDAEIGTIFGLSSKFDEDNGEQPFTTGSPPVDYLAPTAANMSHVGWYLDGTAKTFSPTLSSNQSTVRSYIISAMTVVFRPRGHER